LFLSGKKKSRLAGGLLIAEIKKPPEGGLLVRSGEDYRG
jgi:hypothetical protein